VLHHPMAGEKKREGGVKWAHFSVIGADDHANSHMILPSNCKSDSLLQHGRLIEAHEAVG
jgi:hypothetical protein